MKRTVKPIIYTHNNRTFRIYVVPCGLGLADVNIYEYLPNAKLFKERYRDSYSMWVQDYSSIEEGAFAKMAKFLDEEAERLEVTKKWKDFEEKY